MVPPSQPRCFAFHCLFFSNRRELGSIEEVKQISLEDALSSQEVEVAFICSESSSHEDYIRWVFRAGGPRLAQSWGLIEMPGEAEILQQGLSQWEELRWSHNL